MVRIVHLFIPRENSTLFSLPMDQFLAWFTEYMNYVNHLIFIRNVFALLCIAVCAFSVLSNLIVVTVFLKDGFKATTNISFFALGVSDILVSIVWGVYHFQNHSVISDLTASIGKYMESHVTPAAEVLSTVGSWITVVITWERLCCIAFPLKVKRIFSKKMVLGLLIGGAVYGLLALIYIFIANYVREVGISQLVYGSFNDSRGFEYNYITNVDTLLLGRAMKLYGSIVLSYIPNFIFYGLIFVGTILLIAAFIRSVYLKKTLTEKKGSMKMSTKELKIIQSVILICIIYISTCAPKNAYKLQDNLLQVNWMPSIFIFLREDAVDLIQAFNHALNLFVYLAVNSNFREQFKHIFCVCCFGTSSNKKK
ncbi:chemosensory receptor A [Elysia marginata]|uniref:Chemosensory receptor A n=1 Tax=Elysia marginata TaxID=1093978 RepID=A0AAV4J8D8_9GAST|nr:chemosensory receptor A [Elysia marginata]